MNYYQFVYGFGPFEGDYILYFKAEELNNSVRKHMIDRCISIIDDSINSITDINTPFGEHEFNDKTQKKKYLLKVYEDFVNGEIVGEDYISVDIWKIDVEEIL